MPVPDATIPENGTFNVAGSSAGNYSSLLWSTNGTGSFNNPNILHPVYTPSAADILNGFVDLILTAGSNGPCPGASDTMHLIIERVPIIGLAKEASISSMLPDGSYNVTFRFTVDNLGISRLDNVQVDG